MRKFSISDIESITGIKAHTIRIWEQRYQIIESKRTETNIRYYDDKDVCRFLNISTLTENGFKISEIARMSPEQMKLAVCKLAVDFHNPCLHVNALSDATLNFDEKAFNETLKFCISHKGIKECMVDTIFPFMRKLGLMWQTGAASPAHEHFASDLIKRKLICSINSHASFSKGEGLKFMLFLPEGEPHEIGLLFAHYVLAAEGNHVLYLGQNIPYEDLQGAANSYDPDYCLTCLTSVMIENDVNNVISRISESLQDRKLIVTGPLIKTGCIASRKNLIPLGDLGSFKDFISDCSMATNSSPFSTEKAKTA